MPSATRQSPGGCECPESTCTVTFHVVDTCTGADVPGAAVTISDGGGEVASGSTDSGGLVDLVIPGGGGYTVAVSKSGCDGAPQSQTLACGGVYTRLLWCSDVWHKVCVTNPCSDSPATGADVAITFSDGSTASGSTGEDGCFKFRPKAAGTGSVTVGGGAGDKYLPSTSPITISSLCTPATYEKTVELKTGYVCCDAVPAPDKVAKQGVLVTYGPLSAFVAGATLCSGSVCLYGVIPFTADTPGNTPCTDGPFIGLMTQDKAVLADGATKATVTWNLTSPTSGSADSKIPHDCFWTYDNRPKCTGPYSNQLARIKVACSTDTAAKDRQIVATAVSVVGKVATITLPDADPTAYSPVIGFSGAACPGSSRPLSTTLIIEEI